LADEPGTNPDANVTTGSEPSTPTQGTLDEAQVKAAIGKALEQNEGYKGLQRALERSNQAYQQQLAAKDAELNQLRAKHSEMAEGLDFLSEKFIRALPPEQQAMMADELRQRKITALEKDVATMRQVMSAPPQQMMQRPQFDEDQVNQQMRAILREAQESLEETARDRGFDPKEKGIDYGEETETFAARLKKLNASIKKLDKEKEQADLDGVRQKAPTTGTRTTGGQAVGDFTGKSLWEIGAQQEWDRMVAEARTGKRR